MVQSTIKSLILQIVDYKTYSLFFYRTYLNHISRYNSIVLILTKTHCLFRNCIMQYELSDNNQIRLSVEQYSHDACYANYEILC